MARAIINKHIDDSSLVKRDLFLEELENAKGEILISNDTENPSIYIVNNNNEVVEISGNSSGSNVDLEDYYTKEEIDKKIENIEISGGVDLTEYYKKEETEKVVDNKLDNYYDKSVIDGYVEQYTNEIDSIEEDLTNIDRRVADIERNGVNLDKYYTKEEVYNKEETDGLLNKNNESIETINTAISSLTSKDEEFSTKLEELTSKDEELTTNINENKNNITSLSSSTELLNTELTDLKELTSNISKTIVENEEITSEALNVLNEKVNTINEYTINDKKISENVVLNTNDFVIDESYSTINQNPDFVVTGDLLTTAISKLEVMLANTTLALTAAINDIEARIGTPSKYDEEGNIINEATGLIKRIEELENSK